MSPRPNLLMAIVAAAPALAQTSTEQQARSYLASAFITGAAPVIMSEKVIVSPALQQYLNLPPGADGQATYKAIMGVTSGKQVTVRRAAADEISASEAPQPVSQQPVFALEAGNATLIVQYDLARDNISFVGLPGAVATAAPVMAPTPPEKMADAPAVIPAPAAAESQQKAPQVVEPQIPRTSRPEAATAVAARPAQPAMSMQEPRLPPLKRDGPCVIKPVMSDQDLVNCGATPR